MASVEQQVRSADGVICQNIATLASDRGFLSQNMLAELRNLVEGLIVWVHINDATAEFHYNEVVPASEAIKATAKFRLLSRFHNLLQASASHYTLDRDPSERLMLKYYEYLLRTRDLARQHFGIEILRNLDAFPVDLDPSLREYYEKIAIRIKAVPLKPTVPRRERYYVHSSRPFFINGQICYEVTFSLAHDYSSKSDRTIAFTDIDMTDKYSAYLDLSSETIAVLGRTMPILIVRGWQVSIRPCELENFARFFGMTPQVQSNHSEYLNLMQYLTMARSSLLDLMDMPNDGYGQIRNWVLARSQGDARIFPALDEARRHIRGDLPGSRILRYLLLQMRNRVIKAQYDPNPNRWLSGLRLTSQSSPFDTMPFCTAPRGHVPRFGDLAESFDSSNRPHELLARRVRGNVEQRGVIYTPASELEDLGDVDSLIAN